MKTIFLNKVVPSESRKDTIYINKKYIIIWDTRKKSL